MTNDALRGPVAGAAITHPDWCEPDVCTATPAAGASEAHRSSSLALATDGPLSNVSITASLCQAHRRWRTSVLVDLEVSGVGRDWQPAIVMATLEISEAANLGRTLTKLAAAGAPWQQRQTDDYLTALRKEVST